MPILLGTIIVYGIGKLFSDEVALVLSGLWLAGLVLHTCASFL